MSMGASFLTQRDDGIGAFYLSSLAFDQALPRHGRLHFELPVTHGTVMTAGSFFGSSDGASNADGMQSGRHSTNPSHSGAELLTSASPERMKDSQIHSAPLRCPAHKSQEAPLN